MSQRKFEIGDSAFINSKAPAHLIQELGIGARVEIIDYHGYDSNYHIKSQNGKRFNYIKSNGLDVAPALSKRELLEEELVKHNESIKQIQEKIERVKARIQFMDETGTDEFDENTFKAYQALSIIESGNLSKIEQAQAIANLINK